MASNFCRLRAYLGKHNLDTLLVYFVCSWLEIPVSTTIDVALLSKDKFGLNIKNFSTKFMQSQTSIRKCLQNSKNHDIRKIHQLTSYESNIQLDQFSSARQVVKSIRDNKVDKICTQLTSQGSVITKVWEDVLVCTNSNWFSVHDKMPSNIYNFVNRYLSNSLPTLKNMLLWGTSNLMSCLDCGNSQTLLHVMSGCEKHLHQGRYNWRHNSIFRSINHIL